MEQNDGSVEQQVPVVVKMPDISIAKFLYYLFKCLGLAPLTFTSKKNFCSSTCSLLYNIILIIFVLGISICYIILSDNAPLVQYDRVIDMLYTMLGATCSFYILVHFLIYRQTCANIANKLRTLYELSDGSETRILKKAFKETFFSSFLAWFPFLATTLVEIIIAYQLLIYFIVSFACDAIIYGVILQYSLLLKFVEKLFETVNNNIAKELSLQIFTWTLKFSQLRELQLSLCEVCEELDKFYSKPIFLSVLYMFVKLVFCSYFLAKSLILGENLQDTSILLYSFAHLSLGLTSLYVLTDSTSRVVDENGRTGKVLNRLVGDITDEKIVTKIHQFSIQLLHQRLQFSACGLFLLEGTLTMSIIGSITTYLVILLQYQESNCTSNKP